MLFSNFVHMLRRWSLSRPVAIHSVGPGLSIRLQVSSDTRTRHRRRTSNTELSEDLPVPDSHTRITLPHSDPIDNAVIAMQIESES